MSKGILERLSVRQQMLLLSSVWTVVVLVVAKFEFFLASSLGFSTAPDSWAPAGR
jgi:hypothetical protein